MTSGGWRRRPGQVSFHRPVHPVLCGVWPAAGAARRRGPADVLSRPARTPLPDAGARAARSCPGASRPPSAPGWSGMSRRAGPGLAPWPAPHRGLAGRPAGPPAIGAHAGSSARWHGCASSPDQPPSAQAGNAYRPSSATVLRRPRCGEHLADHPASPAHARDRGLRVIAELLGHPLSAPPAAVGTHGRRGGFPDLTRAGFIGALQHRREQGVGPDRAGAGAVHL